MYGYYTDHLYIASVDGLPEYTGDTVTSAITLYDNDLLIPGKKISVNGVEYTLNSNGVANVTLGPHDAPGDYPLVVKVNGTTVLDQTYPVAQTTYTATSSGSFTQYEQGTLTITAKRNGVAYSGAATIDGNAITFTKGKATYTTTYNTSGKQSLKLVIDGQTITLSVTVAAATYSVEAEDYTVQEYESVAVSFTVKRNGKPYQGAVTLAHNSHITSSTKSTTSNASGLVSITVTGATAGASTISATFGGGTVSDAVSVTVTEATYTASANSTSVQAYNSKSVTFTVKKNDAVYAGAVTIKYSGNLSGPASATANASGQFTISVAASGTTAGNITLTYGGGSDAIAFTVSAATYTVSASPTALTEDLASNVTFTVKRNNVAYDGAVTFSLPSGLSGSTSATATDGKCTNKLTATTTGNKTVTVSFGGGSATATFTVAAATYVAWANISQLYTNDPDSVTFTVKKNNANYAGSVSLSYSSGLSGPASATASGGTFTVSLTATTTGSKTVTLSFGGGTSTVSFSVSASTYALSASPNTLAYNTATAVTFTCKRNGNPITSGVSVTSFGGLSGGTTGAKTTNSAGQFTETLTSTNANGGSYTVSFTDASGNGASTTIAGEAKPEPVYKYDDSNYWTWQSTWSPDGSIGESFVILFYEGQMVAYNGGRGDTDTPTEGIDGHTYLRGELKETNDQSYTRTHKYAIARQV